MTLDEVASCCVSDNRQRFERELLRLKAYRFRSLRIVSSEEAILAHQYRSDITPRAVLASLYAWQAKFDCPLVFCPSAEGAARLDLGDLWPTRGPREAPQSPILACFPSSKAPSYLLERLARDSLEDQVRDFLGRCGRLNKELEQLIIEWCQEQRRIRPSDSDYRACTRRFLEVLEIIDETMVTLATSVI
jgi:hypothetical protein